MYLGFDTSNYTTSVALFDGKNVFQSKKLLKVKSGERGLRQSDAVFQHTVNMPEILAELEYDSFKLKAVGVSTRPRNIDGSYMPCFTVGNSVANAVSKFTNAPLYTTSHQVGHILSALYSVNRLDLINQEFIAFHVSGGTTEALLVKPDKNEIIKAEIIAESLDLKAGQAIDRTGVLLGLTFPCGKEIDALSLKSEKKYKIKPSMKGLNCSLSGVENKAKMMIENGELPQDVSKFVLTYISDSLEKMTELLIEKYGDLPLVFAGGVMSNTLIKNNITQAVTCRAKALEYSEEAVKCGGTLKIHIKVDTGMSRLGYLCDGDYFESGVEGICEGCTLPGLDAEGIFTHFAVSDEFGEEYESYTKHQFELFTSVIDEVEKKLGKKFKIRHCANTGAVARYPETWLDMVRPGLLLYGYGDFAQELGLKPVMSLKTTVSTIKTYPAGTAISYGGIYKTDRKTRMGVVPYGYADGYFRCLSNRYELMTEEGPAPQRGKICMDMCMIDLTDKMNVDVGSEVEIFGKANPIEHMAQLAGTIPYELTCAVSKRVPRMYIKDGKVYEKELLLRG